MGSVVVWWLWCDRDDQRCACASARSLFVLHTDAEWKTDFMWPAMARQCVLTMMPNGKHTHRTGQRLLCIYSVMCWCFFFSFFLLLFVQFQLAVCVLYIYICVCVLRAVYAIGTECIDQASVESVREAHTPRSFGRRSPQWNMNYFICALAYVNGQRAAVHVDGDISISVWWRSVRVPWFHCLLSHTHTQHTYIHKTCMWRSRSRRRRRNNDPVYEVHGIQRITTLEYICSYTTS